MVPSVRGQIVEQQRVVPAGQVDGQDGRHDGDTEDDEGNGWFGGHGGECVTAEDGRRRACGRTVQPRDAEV